MSQVDLDKLASQLEKAHVATPLSSESGVSFKNKQLKLNTEDDAKEIIEAINRCKNLEYLHLGGNTLGVDAAKGIAKALEQHGEFKRALWMDMFTGRMKEEIPKALQFLGAGLALSGAQLAELDLSDNAFGPIGMEGLAALLRSPTCYTLRILKLNNNGLGITGGKLLSRALLDCHASSKAAGQALGLRVFVAGRNRLENDGAVALAQVFEAMGTLEEVSMPQNGIWHRGITALCKAFAANSGLRVVNLNDNTVREKGAASMAQALPNLQGLNNLNLGDCLLKTKGALLLAEALADGHVDLQEVVLGFNEINARGGVALAKAMKNKSKLKVLELGGNLFGKSGCDTVTSELTRSGRLDALASLSEDEDPDDEEEEEKTSSDEDDNSDNESENDSMLDNSLGKTSLPKVLPPLTLNISQVPKSLGEESPKSTIPQVRKLIEEDSPKNADIPHIPKLLQMSPESPNRPFSPGQLLLSPKSASFLSSRSSFHDNKKSVISPKSCTTLPTSPLIPLPSHLTPSRLFQDVTKEPANSEHLSFPPKTINNAEGSKLMAVEAPHGGDASQVSELTQDDVTVTVKEFLKAPTAENFLKFGSNRKMILINEIKNYGVESYLEQAMPLLMKVSALSSHSDVMVRSSALECTEMLYQEVFRWGQMEDQNVELINSLLVHLGLLKTDDKLFVRAWNLEGCISALKHVIKQNYLPNTAKDTVTLFLKRQVSTSVPNTQTVLTPVTIT
ncbi:ran GTPase-activating protein 1 isoform X1 [Bacillus rossius redtenbacheri]|uniref:ran GTPase-activating protein 1 isoform X1 n=1 Tax=Bacillus rossius redtenbacheri TaxID=93214 RepID=UPI002FDD1729